MATLGQKNGITGTKDAWDYAPYSMTPKAAIVAAAGSNSQANATELAAWVNIVTTVSATTRAVKLPTAATGKMVQIHNAAATAVKVYPNTNDKIVAAATNAVGASTIATRKGAIYVAKDAQTWELMLSA